jgi:hypothetical protein
MRLAQHPRADEHARHQPDRAELRLQHQHDPGQQEARQRDRQVVDPGADHTVRRGREQEAEAAERVDHAEDSAAPVEFGDDEDREQRIEDRHDDAALRVKKDQPARTGGYVDPARRVGPVSGSDGEMATRMAAVGRRHSMPQRVTTGKRRALSPVL